MNSILAETVKCVVEESKQSSFVRQAKTILTFIQWKILFFKVDCTQFLPENLDDNSFIAYMKYIIQYYREKNDYWCLDSRIVLFIIYSLQHKEGGLKYFWKKVVLNVYSTI